MKKITKAELYKYVTKEIREILEEQCPERTLSRTTRLVEPYTEEFYDLKNQILIKLKEIQKTVSMLKCNEQLCHNVTHLIKDVEIYCKYTGPKKHE